MDTKLFNILKVNEENQINSLSNPYKDQEDQYKLAEDSSKEFSEIKDEDED